MTIWKKKVRSPIYSLIGSYLCTALWAARGLRRSAIAGIRRPKRSMNGGGWRNPPASRRKTNEAKGEYT